MRDSPFRYEREEDPIEGCYNTAVMVLAAAAVFMLLIALLVGLL